MHNFSSNARPLSRVAVQVLLVAVAALPTIGRADMISEGGADYAVVPLYRSLAFGGIDRDGNGSFASEDIHGVDYASNIAPRAVNNVSDSFSRDGATYQGFSQSAYSGFYAGRNFAQLSISNAQSSQGYYQVAGQGTATSVTFYSSDAAAQRATFTWRVSGTVTNPSNVGRATGRLDFGASTDPDVNWNHLFSDSTDLLDSITEFGPGLYTYTLPTVALGTTINLFYWSSAFAQVQPGQATQGSSFALSANYANTFVLEDVQLLDADGYAIDEWTMEDNVLGLAVFDQAGRIGDIAAPPPIPEPGTWALMVAGLGSIFALRRLRRRS